MCPRDQLLDFPRREREEVGAAVLAPGMETQRCSCPHRGEEDVVFVVLIKKLLY